MSQHVLDKSNKELWAELGKRADIIAALRAENARLREALIMVRGQYKLFVGPDDAIGIATLAVVDAALTPAPEAKGTGG